MACRVMAILLGSLLKNIRKAYLFVGMESHTCLGKLTLGKTSLSYHGALTGFNRIFSFHLSRLGSGAFSASLRTRLDIVSSL